MIAKKSYAKRASGIFDAPFLRHGAAAALVMGLLGGCASTSAPALQAAASPAAATVLPVGQAVQGQLAPGAEQRWRVDLPAGSVVRGEIDATGLQLDVQDAQGQHLRRLLAGDAKGEGFSWLAQPGEQLVLHGSGDAVQAYETPKLIAAGAQPERATPQIGQYRLRLEKSWAPAADQQVTLPNKPLQSPRLQALAQQLQAGGSTDVFWREVAAQGAPMVEPWNENERLVTFVWRGAEHSVRLFGSPSGNHESLQRLGQSDVWWASFVLPRDTRLSYGLAPDVPNIDGTPMDQRRSILATLQRDPHNARTWGAGSNPVDKYQGRSVLQLPDAPPQPWLEKRANVKSGELQRFWLTSPALGNSRDIWLYRPAGWAQAPAEQRGLLVLFDAHAFLHDVPTPQIVDNLMADGLIPNTAVVLVANASSALRGTELPPNPQFAQFIGDELMPWLAAQGLQVPAARTVIAGSSFGGLAASYIALQHPERFGNVLSLSGSYWWAPKGEAPNALARWWSESPPLPVRFYLDAGRFEIARGGQAGIGDANRTLGDALRAKGYAVTQRTHSTGHDYAHWQGSLACGLVALLNPGAPVLQQAACQAQPS